MLSKIQIKFTNDTKNSTSVVAGVPRPTPQKWLEILEKYYKNFYKYSTNISVRVFIVLLVCSWVFNQSLMSCVLFKGCNASSE